VSFDLHVLARRQPKASDLGPIIAANGLRITGAFKRGGSILVMDQDGGAAELDGPNRLEAEDVPDRASGAIRGSGWLVEISAKGPTSATWAMELAIRLARAADGVVFDPQEDAVTWPNGWRSADPTSGVELVDLVELSWYVHRPSDIAGLIGRMLQVVGEHAPEALPKRYGTYEPFQERYEGPGRGEDFARVAVEAAATYTSMVFFSANRPAYSGSLSISSLRKYPPGHGRATVQLSVSFDGRAFARDVAFADRIVSLFLAMASEVKSIYAAACVERDWELRRGRIWSGAATESGPLPRADAWIGLPASPTWMAWFGRPYASEIREAIVRLGHPTTESDDGLFLRVGEQPRNASELAEVFPPLPRHLITRRRDQPGTWFPGMRYALTSAPPSNPAEVIPPID
jgi:hypothetical protein